MSDVASGGGVRREDIVTRLLLIVATTAGVLLTAAASPASAQEWPSKPVHILVGFGAGGGTDVATRILADGLSESLRSAIHRRKSTRRRRHHCRRYSRQGAERRLHHRLAQHGHSVSAVTVKQISYDPVADFAPVGMFTNSAFVVVVPKNSPATDIKSLVEFVNKQPGKLNYSTVGLGSLSISSQSICASAPR